MATVHEGWMTPVNQFTAHYIRDLVSLCGNIRLREHPACGYRAVQTRNNSCRKCRALRATEDGGFIKARTKAVRGCV